MSSATRRQTLVISSILVVTVASIALTLPAATAVRQAIHPLLPIVVIVFGTLAGVWQLVTGIISAVVNGGMGVTNAVALSLGVSALFMALAFLPSRLDFAPHLYAVVGAAIFAVAAGVLQRRARMRSQS